MWARERKFSPGFSLLSIFLPKPNSENSIFHPIFHPPYFHPKQIQLKTLRFKRTYAHFEQHGYLYIRIYNLEGKVRPITIISS